MFDWITVEDSALLAAALLFWVALIYFIVAGGVRAGELVWSGRQPRLLDPSLRVRSLVYGLLLFGSALVLVFASGAIASPIDQRWMESATLIVTVFLGIVGVISLAFGSRWERMFFAPIIFLGAVVSGWMTFVY